MNKKTISLIFIVLAIGIVFVRLLGQNKEIVYEEQQNYHKLQCEKLEIPLFTEERTSQVIEHLGFTLSYNVDWRISNWVAYELTAEECEGEVPRAKHFKPDPMVRGICPETGDYSNSGYDRGHMAPAADMKWSEQAMRESFYLSNICPQNQNLNRGDWNDLEEKVRWWAHKWGKVYVVCGPVVSENCSVIGSCDIAVPDAFFKVVLAQVKGNWQAIGFYFENIAGSKPLRTYAKTIDEIEKIVQLDFFSQLEDEVESKIESQLNLNAWGL